MKKRIGILTSGGDCPGLNATIRGLVKASYLLMDCVFIASLNGFEGLINGKMKKNDVCTLFRDFNERGYHSRDSSNAS